MKQGCGDCGLRDESFNLFHNKVLQRESLAGQPEILDSLAAGCYNPFRRWFMGLRGLTIAALVFALIGSTVVGPGVYLASSGDTNGDRVVDVRDVQNAVAQVLRGSSPDRRADVNADGRVDILDLQRILAEATQAEAPEKEPPTEPRPTSTVPLGRYVPAPPLLCCTIVPRSERNEQGPATGWARLGASPTIPPRTERFLFTLTPHAPPLST